MLALVKAIFLMIRTFLTLIVVAGCTEGVLPPLPTLHVGGPSATSIKHGVQGSVHCLGALQGFGLSSSAHMNSSKIERA